VPAENSESGADATTIGADVLARNYQQRLTWPLTRIRKHFSGAVFTPDGRDKAMATSRKREPKDREIRPAQH
jgi:hypothetical protein